MERRRGRPMPATSEVSPWRQPASVSTCYSSVSLPQERLWSSTANWRNERRTTRSSWTYISDNLLLRRHCDGSFLTVRPFLSGHSIVSSSGATAWREKWGDSCWLRALMLSAFTAMLPKRWVFSSIRTNCGNRTARFWIRIRERESTQMHRVS